ncbi:VacJ family lipoprotein [Aliidiomarina halalkaliphila]|uniref:VacJ family lipoprotein n=2 Tax=Aliidiomarina halalkaliphila TaxID=2593535 RepID=A0A552X6C6_9GAMM|nr:VacJ family lipoprotein [Aliidiomarina halalkaliphila]
MQKLSGQNRTWVRFALGLCLAGLLAGCASKPADEANEFDFTDDRDPFEDFNRSMWEFNREILDRYVALPLANAYENVPTPARRGLYNMTENILEPASIVNNSLQGKGKASAQSFGRFLINSTFGVFGFFDVASKMGVGREKESFGETLAVYGAPDGPYLMLPALGPTVVIDRGGDFVDDFIWPMSFMSWPLSLTRYAIRGLEQRIELKQLEPMLENAIDEYSFVREAYFSMWADKVYDGNPPASDDWDTWDDWDEWDDEWEGQVPAAYRLDLSTYTAVQTARP